MMRPNPKNSLYLDVQYSIEGCVGAFTYKALLYNYCTVMQALYSVPPLCIIHPKSNIL